MNKHISIRFGGDVMLGGGVLEKINQHGPIYPFENLIARRDRNDLFFCNLECTLATNSNPPHPHRIHLHSTPDTVTGLQQAGINVVSLANNHAFDYGLDGFTRTRELLLKNNITTVGGGFNLQEASQTTTINLHGFTVTFLGFCSRETGCLQFASPSEYGVADPVPTDLMQNVSKANAASDIVIVSLHWGEEFRDYPSPDSVALARKLIDQGATIVVGHHSHVFQGFEYYKHGLILYDLGSVIFGDIISKYYKYFLKKRKHREGILVDCRVSKKGVEDFAFLPTWINQDFQATMPAPSHASRIIRRWKKQSESIDSAHYDTFHERYLRKTRRSLFYTKIFTLATNPRHFYRTLVYPPLNIVKKWVRF